MPDSNLADPNARSTKVLVAVSTQMSELRATQTFLNSFLWTTGLSYDYLISTSSATFPDHNQSAADALSHVTSEAWFPNNQGRLKFEGTIGKVLEQVKANAVHTYRAVIVYFVSAFERYLELRVGRHRKRQTRGGDWGPYYESLCTDALTKAACPLTLRTVLRADICRSIRNEIVHPRFGIPTGLGDDAVVSWRQGVLERVRQMSWPAGSVQNDAVGAFNDVIGQATFEVTQAKSSGKVLPLEQFYTLYTFTNLDNLAFEIEEALIQSNNLPEGRVFRGSARVRRSDLVVNAEKGEAVAPLRAS